MSRRIENRFRQLLEAAPDAILEVASDGRIALANAAAQTMFGYTRAELAGQSIEILVPQDRRSVHTRYRAGYAESPRVRPMGPGLELEGQRKDGSLFPVEISLSPNRSGESANVIAIVRDVSQRQHMEMMLRRSEQRLRQAEKLEALGRLAGGIAHEFNNLLSMVLGYSELLLPAVPRQSTHYVEKITASAKRAAALTRKMLAFGRRQMLEPRVLDLNTVVIESCRIASRLLGDNVETVVLPALEPAWIKSDPAQIDQIMANLASNAQAAMPEGGKLTISVSRAEVGESNLAGHPNVPSGNYVLLSVSDTGSGMTPEIQARLFEPFSPRVNSARVQDWGWPQCMERWCKAAEASMSIASRAWEQLFKSICPAFNRKGRLCRPRPSNRARNTFAGPKQSCSSKTRRRCWNSLANSWNVWDTACSRPASPKKPCRSPANLPEQSTCFLLTSSCPA